MEVPDDTEVGETEDGRIRVVVDGDDGPGVSHAGSMPHRAGAAEGKVKTGVDDPADLVDLRVLRAPAKLGRGVRPADSAAKRVGDQADELERLARANAVATGDDNGSGAQVGPAVGGPGDARDESG